MRLYSFQPDDVVASLEKGRPYICDPGKATFLSDHGYGVNQQFIDAYDWLVEEMAERIPRPANVEYPAWSWFRTYGENRKPDRRRGMFTKYDEPNIIELEIPDHEVLLTDFDIWHWVINNVPYQTDEEYEANPDWAPSLEEKVASWQILFDVENSDFTQACIWTIQPESIVRIHRKRSIRGAA